MSENPSDQPDQGAQTPPPSAEPVAEPIAEQTVPEQEINEGKTFAILSYALSFVSLPFFLVPLIMRNNAYALYHAKQSLMIWLGGIAVSLVGSVLLVVCIGAVILLAGGIFLLVLNIMGLINAINGKMEPIPVIGKWGEDWFKGLNKVA